MMVRGGGGGRVVEQGEGFHLGGGAAAEGETL